MDQAEPASITSLPQELFDLVLGYLSYGDKYSLVLCNRRFHHQTLKSLYTFPGGINNAAQNHAIAWAIHHGRIPTLDRAFAPGAHVSIVASRENFSGVRNSWHRHPRQVYTLFLALINKDPAVFSYLIHKGAAVETWRNQPQPRQ